MDKYQDYVERWIDKHPDDAFSSDFEIKVSQLSLAMLVKFLISKNIINEEEFSAFMTDTEEQIKAFKEMFEEE